MAVRIPPAIMARVFGPRRAEATDRDAPPTSPRNDTGVAGDGGEALPVPEREMHVPRAVEQADGGA